MVETLRPAAADATRTSNGTRPGQRGRRLVPRTGLPGGRAALGGLLVALAALALFLALSQRTTTAQSAYVVATRALPQGTRLQRGDLALRHGPLAGGLRTHTFASLRAIPGGVLLGPVRPGDPLLRDQVAPAGRAPVAPQLSFAVAPERALGGTLRVGDHLRVLVTYGQDADAPTQVAAADVEVLDVQHGDAGALGDASALVVTVAVPRDRDATALARATTAGKITLVRLGSAPTP